MKDRIPVNPGRVLITPESGSPYYATLTRADNPTQEGDPLNKNTLLKDATAALFGLGSDAVPNDVLNVIKNLIDAANTNANSKAKIETGSYTGNGNYQSGNPISLTFGFAPKIVFVCKSNSGITESGLFLPLALKTSNTQYGYAYMTSSSGFVIADRNYAKFSDNTLTWYFNGTNAASQLNSSGITYHYIAIG